ncbi:MAG: hypothetical protein Q4D38_02525 [Planctomycetia bacterium]|nr:hypothetical protein [Planctomycetia bacterium]
MKDVYIILPSQSMDSLALSGTAAECDNFLTAWCSFYHPRLLGTLQTLPKPFFGLYVYEEPSDLIFITPKMSRDILDPSWIERAEERGCVFLSDFENLDDLVRSVLRHCMDDAQFQEEASTQADEKTPPSPLASELEIPNAPTNEDFLALGLAHLLSEVFSQKMQYQSYLDDFSLKTKVLGALGARTRGAADEAQQMMRDAWDLLIQSRQYYAPSEGYLFDLVLLAPEVVSPELVKEFANGGGEKKDKNILTDASTLEEMSTRVPEALEALASEIQKGCATLLGGEYKESNLPLLTQEGILRRLQHGLLAYERLLGARPSFFGRRRFGLTPHLPNILRKLGFLGALHCTLDDGIFPTSEHTRIAWKGLDNSTIESIFKIPLRAESAEAIVSLPAQRAQTMNIDNAPSVLFARWVGEKNASLWFRLLKRSADWVPLFGDLSTFDSCVESTQYASFDTKFLPDAYISPYLSQEAREGNAHSDPISRWMRYHQLRVRLEALLLLEGMRDWLALSRDLVDREERAAQRKTKRRTKMRSAKKLYRAALKTQRKSLEKDEAHADDDGDDAPLSRGAEILYDLETREHVDDGFFQSARHEIRELEKELMHETASLLSNGGKSSNALVLFNPWCFASQRAINLSDAEEKYSFSKLNPEEDACVKRHIWEEHAQHAKKPTHAAILHTPSMGFAIASHSENGSDAPPPKTRKRSFLFFSSSEPTTPPPIYQDPESRVWIMANERLTLRFDPYTGHLRSVFDNYHRGNRFSQQLAMRVKSAPYDSLSEDSEEYSVQAADKFEPLIFADRSEMRVSGRLMGRDGKILAQFIQITTLRRGSDVVEFDITLTPEKELGRNPWQSYYASRLAWGDAAVDLFRSVGFANVATNMKQLEAPYFIDIRPIKYSATSRVLSAVTKEAVQRIRGEEVRDKDFLPERNDEDLEYADSRLTLLTNGIPYHRYVGMRRIDTLLIVRGESARRFRLGVSVNTPYPMNSALKFMSSPLSAPIAWENQGQMPNHGWLGHLSHKNIIVTHLESRENGAIVRFAETEGRLAKASFQTFLEVQSATLTDFLGQKIQDLVVENGRVHFDISSYGFIQMELKFKGKKK